MKKWKDETNSSSSYLGAVVNVINNLKNGTYKFNKKNGMYETTTSYTGYTRIKFNNKKIIYVKVEMGLEEAEFFFTDYGKTEIKQAKPTVEKNKLEIAYNTVMKLDTFNSKSNINLSEDCSYMTFTYNDGSNDEDFEMLNNALGLPNGSVVATMRETTTLNKRDTAKENGIIVTWVKVSENVNNSNGGTYEVTYILE